ncbi:MAG: ABC transporter ATP-binding protein [Acidimicrobiales bacterium]
MTGLEVDVSVARPNFNVRVALHIGKGEHLALFGPSGAGKTTLLEAIAGLVEPVAGSVKFGAEVLSLPPPPSERRAVLMRRLGGPLCPTRAAVRHVSLVRQPTALFPHLDVEANVRYGNVDAGAVGPVLEGLGLLELRRSRPALLSGGQAQRVVLARALSRKFSVLLLDEPMAAVDAATRRVCWSVIRQRCAQQQAIVVLVTHDLDEAQGFGDQMAIMDDGAILQVGDPHELVAAPASRRVAEVVGYHMYLHMRRVDIATHSGGLEVALDPGRIRLEALVDNGVVCPGVVTACRAAWSGYEVTVAVPAGARLGVPLTGEWIAALSCDLEIHVDRPVSLGTQILATALTPPVVVGGITGQGTVGRPLR